MSVMGIDLGTTNSLAVVYKDGKSVLIPNAFGEYLTPSVVSLIDGQIVVGKIAKERLVTHPSETASLFKRTMGTKEMYRLGKEEFDSATLSSFVVKQLMLDAEKYLNETIDEVVISVPAYFNARQRQDTKKIGELLGVKVERLINEPSAAAIAVHEEDAYETFVVFDFGGGTLDVSVVDCFENVISINAISGNNHLGGTDFDLAMAQYFCQKNQLNYNALSNSTRQSLLRACEKAKIDLDTKKVVEVSLKYQNQICTCIFDAKILYSIGQSLLAACKTVIGKAVKDSGFHANELDSVILVGGSSQMPILQEYLEESLNVPVLKLEHMDTLVAMGLGKYIGIKEREEGIRDIVVTDICPFSLCTSTYNHQDPNHDLALVIIPKNSVLPSSKKISLQTLHKGQNHVDISVYQGQAMYAKDNLLLGKAQIQVPRNLSENESFDLIYSYDINSMLYVETIVHSTKEHTIFRVGDSDRLEKVDSSKQLQSIQKISKQIYQSDEVEAMLARMERMYEEVDESTQGYLRELHNHFSEDMKQMNNNVKKRNALIQRVYRVLDDIESMQDVENLDIFYSEEDEESSGGFLA